MYDEMERTGRSFCGITKYYTSILLEGLKTITQSLRQGNLCPNRDKNQPPPEHYSRALPLHHSVQWGTERLGCSAGG
jgi:hypothetical protein